MNIEELPDDSDTSDDDYIPSNKQEDLPSEDNSDNVSEDALSDKEDLGKRGKKRMKKLTKSRKKTKIDDLEVAESPTLQETEPEKVKKDDDIWADFLKDTGFKSKNALVNSSVQSQQKIVESPKVQGTVQKAAEKVKVVQVFEFAGEEVKVEKEVASNSAEARLLGHATNTGGRGRSRGGGLSGISNVLSQIGKKQKISTLEKSKLDWDKFKKDENLEEELTTYNRGKDGYLERQDFLVRADLRRFEIEKEIRTIERNKRMNNTM